MKRIKKIPTVYHIMIIKNELKFYNYEMVIKTSNVFVRFQACRTSISYLKFDTFNCSRKNNNQKSSQIQN
jgi:hypothetical protein